MVDSKWLSTTKAQDKLSILFLVLGVPFFFPLIFLGKVPGPFAAGAGDSYGFFEPYARVFMHALSTGENPFWSHESSFGAPTLLTLGTGALHPFHLFHLVMPDWLAFAIGCWARIALFSAYIYAYLRIRLVRPWVALSFTLSLSFGSFFVNYSIEIIGYVMAFFPMALYYADKLCVEAKVTDFVLLVLAIACMILGGFPSVILYLLLTLGAYLLVMAKGWKLSVVVGLACCTGVLMVLPTIIETLCFYPGTGYDPEQRKWLFFYDPPPITALNLVIPSVFGKSFYYRNAGMRDFYGSLLGSGILTFPLAVILATYSFIIKKTIGRTATFWLSVLAFCLVAYFNIFQIKEVLKYLPVLNEHPFTRLQTLIAVASATSAALLLECMLVLPLRPRQWCTILGALGLVLFMIYIFAASTLKAERALLNCTIYGAIAVLSILALTWTVLRPNRLVSFSFVACNVILGIVTTFSYTYYFSPKDYYPEEGLIEYVKDNLVFGARVLDVQNVLYHNTAIAYGIPSITNHWFSPPSLRSLVQQISPLEVHKGLTLDVINVIDEKKAWPILRQMHVQFVSLPYVSNHLWIDSHKNTDTDWLVISKNVKDVCLLEVLFNGKKLKDQHGISGDGYSDYIEHAGSVIFQPIRGGWITIPVRFHDGWHIAKGAIAIEESSNAMMRILVSSSGKPVELECYPRHFC